MRCDGLFPEKGRVSIHIASYIASKEACLNEREESDCHFFFE